ncbi:Type 1 glutamine amidotransferase-like domain-containing protein [Enterococcus pallens]|uniref:Peptidase n=1 Tax=Enterococcus pallens ATCC BAA-351 TaxID=1158607 RepID=R2SPU5_9ENTE|nr:Type 1 glutamine amidotransferase-like domain-containing protein [Enterococcus pallens]EOH90174.1 hypothetical protein UAU_04003 [Enterococcus pallens ATCC BAA-351]EOU15220.1 hypothetical protein I588_04152 [Enterococcus pallens ATCC BAA-351]
MRRLLLVSMFQNVAKLLNIVEPHLANQTVTYIPTASKVERLGFFTKIGKRRLKKLGLTVEEVDVTITPYASIKAALEKNEIIYVAGGNTFFLLQELKKSGADQLIINEVNKGKLYIGESAGAIAAAPDIRYSAAMDNVEKAPELQDYAGLNLLDFYVVPHYQNWEMGKAAEAIIETYGTILNLKPITDHQAIWVKGVQTTILHKKQANNH